MSYNMDMEEKIVWAVFALIVILFCSIMYALATVAKHRAELSSECLADPKYDKFQCRAMIYGDSS